MDYSNFNTPFWNSIIQIGIIAVILLLSNILVRKISFIRCAMIPTAVLGGFILLLVKSTGLLSLDMSFMEKLTYHGIAIGFIALSLRVPEKSAPGGGQSVGLKSGAVIVSSYMIQGIIGMLISLLLSYTFMPSLFQSAGLLLPMGYGQGPGQANNVGSSYEALGFVGGRSFGLAIAAAGYLCACTVGVFYINYLSKKGKLQKHSSETVSGSVTVDTFQQAGEAPISDSVDRLSIQVGLVISVYLAAYLVTWGLTSLLACISQSIYNTLSPLLWGFNFIIGSALATLTRVIMKKLRSARLMQHQYQNNYLLSRISGLAFDIMIIAGIASIDFGDLEGLWVPFLLMSVAGAVVTLLHLKVVCKKVYGDYYYEGLVSMYGMMTGTISSGVLLLRELDPHLKTPASNNLILGSSFAILLGAPLLLLISIMPRSSLLAWIGLGCLTLYYLILLTIISIKPKKKHK